MKFGQSIEYNKGNILIQKPCKNEAGRLAPDLFLFFKKELYEVKVSGLQLGLTIIWWPLNEHTIKTNCIKLLDSWSRDKLNCDFF